MASPPKKRCMANNIDTIIYSMDSWEDLRMVWAKISRKWWPGLIIKSQNSDASGGQQQDCSVFLFGYHRISQVAENRIVSFKNNYQCIVNKGKTYEKMWLKGVIEALSEIVQPYTRETTLDELSIINKLPFVEDKLKELPKWIEAAIQQSYNRRRKGKQSIQSKDEPIKEVREGQQETDKNNLWSVAKATSSLNILVCPIQHWEIGSVVWAQFSQQWWPALVLKSLNRESNTTKVAYLVFWFGDEQVSEVSSKAIICFKDNYENIFIIGKKLGKEWLQAIEAALQQLAANDDLTFYELKDWAKNGFDGIEKRANEIPYWILDSAAIKFPEFFAVSNQENEINKSSLLEDEKVTAVDINDHRQNTTSVVAHSTRILWQRGNIVWAKFSTKWWCAMVVELPNEDSKQKKYTVFWFGDKLISRVSAKKILPFKQNYQCLFNKGKRNGKLWLMGVEEALKELAPKNKVMNFNELQEWVKNDFANREDRVNEIPNWIKAILKKPGCSQKHNTNDVQTQKATAQEKQSRQLHEVNAETFNNENAGTGTIIINQETQNNAIVAHSTPLWQSGNIVWAEFSSKWWSAMIIELINHDTKTRQEKYTVFWFGDKRISPVSVKKIVSFKDNFQSLFSKGKTYGNIWLMGVQQALKELAPTSSIMNFNELRLWAKKDFVGSEERVNEIPHWIRTELQKCMKKVNQKHRENVEVQIPFVTNNCDLSVNQKETIKRLSEKGKPFKGICLACYTNNVVDEHPYFYGHVCVECKNKIIRAIKITQGNKTAKFCIICANPDPTVFCSNEKCTYRAYCNKCLDNLSALKNRLEKLEDRWLCFRCIKRPIKTFNGVIFPRMDFEVMVQKLINNDSCMLINKPVLASTHKLRVLSLLDTLAAGLVALRQLKIPVEKYYCVETNVDAIGDSFLRDKIMDLGKLENLCSDYIRKLGPIDLVLIGSPSVNTGLPTPNMNDSPGKGINLFEFHRIITILTRDCSHNFFWFFEVPSSAPIQYKLTITRYLQCEPITVDAPWIALKKHPRMFWGNIPTLNKNLNRDLKINAPIVNTKNNNNTSKMLQLERSLGFVGRHSDNGTLSVSKREEMLHFTWNVEFLKYLFNFL